MAANPYFPNQSQTVPMQGQPQPVQPQVQQPLVQPQMPQQLAQPQQYQPVQANPQPVANQVDVDMFAPKPFVVGADGSVMDLADKILQQQPPVVQPPQFNAQQQPFQQQPQQNLQQLAPQQLSQVEQFKAMMQLDNLQQQAGQLNQMDQSNPMIQALVEQNKQTQALVQQLLQQQVNQNKPAEFDPLALDASELMLRINGDPDSGKPTQIKEILAAVKNNAVREMEEKFAKQEAQLQAITRQHNEAQAKAQIGQLKSKYGQDPMFQQNLKGVVELMISPKGKAYFDAFPESAFETAYLTVQGQAMNNPAYQQALAQQQLAFQQQQNALKLQAGMPSGVTQTVVPFPTLSQQPQQQDSDAAFLQKLLSSTASGY